MTLLRLAAGAAGGPPPEAAKIFGLRSISNENEDRPEIARRSLEIAEIAVDSRGYM